MASPAQVHANQANAKKSTGPVTEEGKARVASNRFTHGLTSADFKLLEWEDPSQFQAYCAKLKSEMNPQTPEEVRLVDAMIQHGWLAQRALSMQHLHLFSDGDHFEKRMALYIRYQTTNERSYYRARKELQTIRKQRDAERIGFESQNRKQAESEARVRLTNARTEAVQAATDAKKNSPPPTPPLDYAELKAACQAAIRQLQEEMLKKQEEQHHRAAA
jgi:hypothetical protein